jgi:hypothetical protein
MPSRSLFALLMLVGVACDPPKPLPVQAAPLASAIAGVVASEAQLKAEALGAQLADCVERVGAEDTLWMNTCVMPGVPLEVIDHVPPIAVRGGQLVNAEVLSYFLGLDFPGAYRPTLLLLDGEQAAVAGAYHAITGLIPAAGAMSVSSNGRIGELRIWFDQRAANKRLPGAAETAPPAELVRGPAVKPRIVVALHDAAEAAHVQLFERAASASRQGDSGALAGLYADAAVLYDAGAGVEVRGAAKISALLGIKHRVEVERRWAAGRFVVAELRREEAAAPGPFSLEILEVEQGRIATHWMFRSRYRSDIAAGRAAAPAARADAAPIRQAGSVTLHEGLPHQRFEADALEAERKTKPVIERQGYPFYAEALPLKLADAQWLSEVLVDEASLKPFSGEKKCGGFHPDYVVTWDVSGKQHEALLCFGCGEVKWAAPDGKTTRYDMTHWANASLQAVLRGYPKNRPPSKP